jgi:hypothetical protein
LAISLSYLTPLPPPPLLHLPAALVPERHTPMHGPRDTDPMAGCMQALLTKLLLTSAGSGGAGAGGGLKKTEPSQVGLFRCLVTQASHPGGVSTADRLHWRLSLQALIPYSFVHEQISYLTRVFCDDSTHAAVRSMDGLSRLGARRSGCEPWLTPYLL